MQKKRIVITGGPATGKSSIIHLLQKKGHHCFEEISREIIREEMSKNSDVLPWDNLMAFSNRVIHQRVEQFNAAKEGIQFYDRSVLDTIAYLHFDKLEIIEEWDTIGQRLKYFDKVFITPPWLDIFETDNERKESFHQLEELHNVLVTTYKEYGYNLIEVPKTSIEERVSFILKNI